MVNSKNIVVTNHRLEKDLTSVYEKITGVKSSDVRSAVEDRAKIKLGKLTRWFPGANRCTCRLNDKEVECSVLHSMFGSDAYSIYTPRGSLKATDDKSRYYIVPSDELYCALLEVESKDYARYLMIGFVDYDGNDCNITDEGKGEYVIHVGGSTIVVARNHIRVDCNQLIINGLSYMEAKGEIEELDVDGTFYSRDYVDEHYYSKDEVDKLLDDLKKELKGE